MDLSLQGRWALVCAAGKGVGMGCARVPVAEGGIVVICAHLCSAHAGYVSGQNVLIDGGTYPGTM